MKVHSRKIKVGVLLFAILMGGFLGLYFYAGSGGEGSGMIAEAKQTYLFVNPTSALSTSTGTTFLEEEAGISIYVNIGVSIDLSKAKTVYKTIEKETSDYIVGSLSLPNLPETEDVHCFVHKDGWIVVYYLKAEPISKIIDWNYYSGGKLTKTKLLVGLEKMGLALGATITGAKYYNFQYPYADKWMIIFESIEDGIEDSFNIKIPSTFDVYERSWSLYSPTGSLTLYIDVNYIDYASYGTKCGTLTVAQLGPDALHTVKIHSTYDGKYYSYHSAIVLTYKEP